MGRLLNSAATALVLALVAPTTEAQPFEISVDLRAVSSSGQTSFLNGGLGKLRFDSGHDGLRLGELRVGFRHDIGSAWHLNAEAAAWGDHDRNPIDLTELYAAWRPLPHAGWRHELKIGAFYPAISLENRMRGWRSPYTLSASAINTWIGEELRTIGMEYGLKWLGRDGHGDLTAGLNAAVYGWNDPAGVVIALRGWSLHDRQTTLFGRVGQPGQGIVDGRTIFYTDIDDRAGWYAGPTLKYRGLLELRALRYDNRGNTAKAAPAINDSAWRTEFDSFGLRYTPSNDWTFAWQRLYGRTLVCDCQPDYEWRFGSSYLLASWTHGRQRLSARYDRFDMQQTVYGVDDLPGGDDGHALTAAWSVRINERMSLTAEWLEVNSVMPWRDFVTAPREAREHQLQLAWRYDLLGAATRGE